MRMHLYLKRNLFSTLRMEKLNEFVEGESRDHLKKGSNSVSSPSPHTWICYTNSEYYQTHTSTKLENLETDRFFV